MTERKRIRAIKGVRDILPPETALWNRVEQTAHGVFANYGFGEIRLPEFEDLDLFERSVGKDTDIVNKELYTFFDPFDRLRDFIGLRKTIFGEFEETADLPDEEEGATSEIFVGVPELVKEIPLKGKLLALRPEATASVCRAYIEHGMHTWPGNVKLYYLGPMFRRERPQKGRYRQFYQIGAEVLTPSRAGEESLRADAAVDAEVIEMLVVLFDRLGLKGTTLSLNSIGCKECLSKYVELLRSELEKVKDKLGADSQRRVETNPLRVLDSKVPEEQTIIEKLPRIADHLCEACRAHFATLQEQLKLRGIAYEINWRLVRGLDYYMRTTFEITAPGLGSQNAVCGGGRYDGLVELLGGPPTKGIGFAIGTDRVILSLQESGKGDAKQTLDVYIAWMDSQAYPAAVALARKLRTQGFAVEVQAEEMKLGKSLNLADRLRARYAVIIGEEELLTNQFTIKRLFERREPRTLPGKQKRLAEADLLEYLKNEEAG